MENKNISSEQKAHDLAVAYTAYLAATYEKEIDIDIFYQDYENAYRSFLSLVKANS